MQQARSHARRNGNQPVEAASSKYQRHLDLPRILPLFEAELATPTLASHARLLALVRRALRAERMRGAAGDWCYDLARHSALLKAFRAERQAYRDRLRRAQLLRGSRATRRPRPA